jgi:Membrane-bound metallopeptidase
LRADRVRAGGVWPVVGERETLQGKFPGVLIRADRGTPVQAIATGRVVYAGPHSSFGNVVFVQNTEGYVYVYGGQDAIAVTVGATVAAGDSLGTVGSSPGDGDGMYFSVWRDDQFVDPDGAPRG